MDTMRPPNPAYTAGTPGSALSSSPVDPTMSPTTTSIPPTVIGLPESGRRTPAKEPSALYRTTVWKSRARRVMPRGWVEEGAGVKEELQGKEG